MSLSTEINRIETAKADIKAAIEEKGVTVPNTTKIDGMAALISSIEAGGGGVNIAEGTFGLSADIKGDNCSVKTISGMKFKPTHVIVLRLSEYTSGDTTTKYTSLSGHYQVIAAYNTPDYQGSYTFFQSSSTSTAYLYVQHDGRWANITINNDGFTLKGDGTKNGNAPYFAKGKYYYIAIG